MSFPGSILLNQGDIYKETSDKRYPLGTRGYTRDGRVFRYAECSSTAIASPGSLCQACVPPDAGKWSFDLVIGTVPTSNSTSIYITATTACATANYFADGYLFTNDGTGLGQLVQVKSHAVMTSGATAQQIKLYEEDKIITTITTATVCGLVPNPYKDVIIKPATAPTANIVGVNPIDITANYFFWLQTWGPCPVIVTGALALANPVVCSTATAGAAQKMTTGATVYIQQPVGLAISVAQGADDAGLVFLQIAP